MKTTLLLAGLVLLPGILVSAPVPLTESTFTEIIRDAKVVAAADKTVVAAKVDAVFHAPDKVRTGPASRVEMTAPDKTITRIGANTVFTFETGGRDIDLEKGSLLFHSPAGVGGGTVRYRGTAAAVLGTTMICAVLNDGSFKILDLEGKVKVTLKNGMTIILKSGQMIVVPADGTEFRAPEYFNLREAITRLVLVVGFSDPLSSLPLIEEAIQQEDRDFHDGTIAIIVDINGTTFGLEVVVRPTNWGTPYPPETPDHTMLPVSQTHP